MDRKTRTAATGGVGEKPRSPEQPRFRHKCLLLGAKVEGLLLIGPHAHKASLLGGAQGEMLNGQTPSSPERRPDHLISVPGLVTSATVFPQGIQSGLTCADCYLSRAQSSAFSVTSSKDKLGFR